MKKINYFSSSFLGFVPGFFVFNTIGAGLNTYIQKTEEFSLLNLILTSEIYFPLYNTKGLQLQGPDYQKKIRYVITFDPRTLTQLFSRKWF